MRVRSVVLLNACLLVALPLAAADENVEAGPNYEFIPNNISIQVGDSVTWTAVGGLPHNVVTTSGVESFRCANGCGDQPSGDGDPAVGWSLVRTFNAPGQVNYISEFHGSSMSGTITIEAASETGQLRFTGFRAATPLAFEGGSVLLRVARIGGDDGPAAVNYATTNGSAVDGSDTAVAGSDYTATNGTLNWPDGNDDTMIISVPILQDTLVEGSEVFTVTLSGASGAALGSPATATVKIVDDDEPAPSPGTLRFTFAAFQVNEGAGNAILTVVRVNGDTGSASVNFATANGSAVAGSDFINTNGTLNWGNGDADGKKITVPLVSDSLDEASETLTVSLSGASGATLGAPSTATLTIFDDDGPDEPGVLALTLESVPVSEGAWPMISVSRTGGDGGEVSVDWQASDGSAIEDLDWEATGGTLTWPNFHTRNKSFWIPIIDDFEIEDTETINVALSNPTGGATLGRSSSTVMIIDNDTDVPPCVSSPTVLCLSGTRFQVEVDWRTPNATGQGMVHDIGLRDSGTFYFFDNDNLEMLFKVLNGCAINDRYWVFFAATTNVEFTVTVTDTERNVPKTYFNPLNRAAPPITDTDAFVTCP